MPFPLRPHTHTARCRQQQVTCTGIAEARNAVRTSTLPQQTIPEAHAPQKCRHRGPAQAHNVSAPLPTDWAACSQQEHAGSCTAGARNTSAQGGSACSSGPGGSSCSVCRQVHWALERTTHQASASLHKKPSVHNRKQADESQDNCLEFVCDICETQCALRCCQFHVVRLHAGSHFLLACGTGVQTQTAVH